MEHEGATATEAAGYTIQQRHGNVLAYSEGDGQTVTLNCSMLADPPQVRVPDGRQWAERVPPWAWERRSAILDRLRLARCVVWEEDGRTSRIRSPDGTFCISTTDDEDERGSPLLSTNVVRLPTGESVLWLYNHTTVPPITFPAPGRVSLTLRTWRGWTSLAVLDVATGSYRLPTTGAAGPLAGLARALDAAEPQVPVSVAVPPMPRLSRLVLLLAWVAGGLFAAGAGVWMAATPRSTSDRLAGVVSVLLFGGSAAVAVSDLRRWNAALQRRLTAVGGELPKPWWVGWIPYGPLVALITEIPWAVIVFVGVLFLAGDKPFTSTPAQERFAAAVFALPAIGGLVWGAAAAGLRLCRRRVDRVVLAVGCAGCGVFVGWILRH